MDLVDEHGLGVRNERGERIKLFIEEEDLIILNTLFKLPPLRLCTWTLQKTNRIGLVGTKCSFPKDSVIVV